MTAPVAVGPTATDEAAYREAEAALWAHHGVAPTETRVRLSTLDTDVRVVEAGAGRPVLLLHGSPTAGANWASLVGALLATDGGEPPPGLRCLVPDLPPGGLTGPHAVTRDTVGAYLRHLVGDLVAALEVDRVDLVASSSGSLFALHAAAVVPDRIGRVVHCGAPWLVDGLPQAPVDTVALVPGVARLLGRFRPGPRLQRRLVADIGHRASIEAGRIPDAYWDWTDALIHRTDTFGQQIRMTPAFGGRGLRYSRDVVVGADVLAAQPPTLLVWGEDETLASVDEGRRLAARLPDGSFELVRGAGHLPWLDHPDRVADSVTRFLQET